MPRWPTLIRLLAPCLLVMFAGCEQELKAPPVEVSHRESLIGAGRILQVKNLTNEELVDLEITIQSENGEVTYRHPQLGGFEVLEVGWKKLGGWQIPDGAEVEVRAEGYLVPYRGQLSEEPVAEQEPK